MTLAMAAAEAGGDEPRWAAAGKRTDRTAGRKAESQAESPILAERRSQDRSLQAMLETLALSLGFQFGACIVNDEGRGRVAAGYGVKSLRAVELIEICDVPARLQRLLHVPDPVRHTDLSKVALVQHEKGVRFFCGMPLYDRNRLPIGTLALFDFRGRRLTQEQLTHFQGMAGAMEEILALRAMSVHDPLTGLYNRQHFDQAVARECSRSQRADEMLSVLVVDIDGFDLFNQTHGRQAGTHALRQLALLLETRFSRAGDLLARYCDDEFVLALTRADSRQAEATARRLQRAVRSLNIRYRGALKGQLTVSVGVVCGLPEALAGDDSGERLLLRAYAALRAGRGFGVEQIVTYRDDLDDEI